MRDRNLVSDVPENGVGPHLFTRFRSAVLWPVSIAAIINVHGQGAFLSSPKALLATDPEAFVQWLESNRPKPVPADRKARILRTLPGEGELRRLDRSSSRKLASLTPLLQATGRDSAYEIKVTDVQQVRIVLYERTVLMIPGIALGLLDADELQAVVTHEIAHEYVAVDYARASARNDRRRLKDLELLCDAIAIVTLQRLNLDPSRLMTGLEKITRYNWNFFEAEVERRSYPSLSERRKFAREVTTWLSRASTPQSSR
jgi:predicted Zn-dependent protease